MTRTVVVGSADWRDRRLTMSALRRVMDVYKPPYTLVCDMSDGASRYALAGARELGWEIEPRQYDESKCAPDCPPGHRREGGPEGSWCVTARRRNLDAMIESDPDVVIAFIIGQKIARMGQHRARELGIAQWDYRTGGKAHGNSSG
jgi:hypothetical protein